MLIYISFSQAADFSSILDKAKKVTGSGSGLTNSEMIEGLKEALTVGTQNVVASVSQVDGYYRNPAIKIPLPEQIEKAGKYLRMAGYGNKVDEFELSMNRAAEQAAPEAKQIFWDAVKEMHFEDAQTILNGPENAATEYFRDKTYPRLQSIFEPIVNQSMAQVGVTRQFQAINSKLDSIPFAEKASVDIDQYVTEKSLDGLFVMLAAEEREIRQDPGARVTDILKKVFGGAQ
jgi:hypothetical protein